MKLNSYTPQFDYMHSLVGLLGAERYDARIKSLIDNIRRNKEMLIRLQKATDKAVIGS